MAEMLRSMDKGVQTALRGLCIVLFSVLALLLLANVGLRLVNDFSIFLGRNGLEGAAAAVKALCPISSLHWFDEIVELCFAALVFYGAAALWGTKGHFCVGDWISSRLPNRSMAAVYKALISLISVAFMAIFFWFSLSLVLHSTELTTVFQIPKSVLYSCMPISSAIMLAYSLVDVCLDIRNIFAQGETLTGSGTREARSL